MSDSYSKAGDKQPYESHVHNVLNWQTRHCESCTRLLYVSKSQRNRVSRRPGKTIAKDYTAIYVLPQYDQCISTVHLLNICFGYLTKQCPFSTVSAGNVTEVSPPPAFLCWSVTWRCDKPRRLLQVSKPQTLGFACLCSSDWAN